MRPKRMPKTASKTRAMNGEPRGDGEDFAEDGGNGPAGEVLAEVEGEDALEVEQVLERTGWSRLYCARRLAATASVNRLSPNSGGDGVAGKAEDQEVDQQCGTQEDVESAGGIA